MKLKLGLTNKWLVWTLFALLFAYALLRAWWIVPMLDELATFYAYIRTGHYFNTIELVDANNHVINSLIGHQFYTLFGEHFFLFRLLSLFAFPIYFFSLKYIVQKSISSKWSVLIFIALISVPWIFEYFSYSRGYALAIASFFAAIAFILRWKESKSWVHFLFVFVFLFLAIASSLTYLMPSILLFSLFGLILLLEFKSLRKLWVYIGIIIGWFAAITPFVRYSFELKEAGALWWGSQDGFWEITGKSLSRIVLFSEAPWVFYLICALLLFCTVSFVWSAKTMGLWSYLKQTDAMLFLLLSGSLIGIVLMRYLFDVNYPMDRVGMYLIPLFILTGGVFLVKNRYTKYAAAALVFFPLSFLYHLNISTSIFSPEDRIPVYLTDDIKSKLTDHTALSAEYVSHMSYAYSCRNDEKVHIAYTAEKEEEQMGDFHINWLGLEEFDGYRILTRDSESHTTFFQRRNAPSKELLLDTLIEDLTMTDMYYTILSEEMDDRFLSGKIQVEISGKFKLDQPTRSFNFIRSTEDKNGNRISASSPSFDWYFGERTDVHFSFVDKPFSLRENDHNLTVFMINGDVRKMDIDFLEVRVYSFYNRF